MGEFPRRPDLEQLRRRAKDLLRAAKRGDADALAKLHAVSDRVILDSAQLAVAREHGFASWPKLKSEIDRRTIFDSTDVTRLRALLVEHPELAVEEMRNWCDHPRGVSPLGYVAMLRYDTSSGVWRDVAGTGAMARALLDAGAPVDGTPTDPETPLMTAASYGDAEVAQVLIDAGADLDATATPTAGGVPGGTALRHAAVFDMTGVVDILLAAGARDLVQSAAAGDITGMLAADTLEADRVAALRIAAAHARLDVRSRKRSRRSRATPRAHQPLSSINSSGVISYAPACPVRVAGACPGAETFRGSLSPASPSGASRTTRRDLAMRPYSNTLQRARIPVISQPTL